MKITDEILALIETAIEEQRALERMRTNREDRLTLRYAGVTLIELRDSVKKLLKEKE